MCYGLCAEVSEKGDAVNSYQIIRRANGSYVVWWLRHGRRTAKTTGLRNVEQARAFVAARQARLADLGLASATVTEYDGKVWRTVELQDVPL